MSEDGKTVTVKIKPGVKYSPPYNHVVTSKDVKYAIERGFFNSVGQRLHASYYGDLEGAKVGVKPGTKISGITTPDDTTVVLKFKRAVGGVLAAGALALPAHRPGARGVRRRSSTPRRRRRTARTSSPPART